MVLEMRAEAAELSRRLEHHRTVTRLGQEVRGREPGDAAADHGDAQRPPATAHETQGGPLVRRARSPSSRRRLHAALRPRAAPRRAAPASRSRRARATGREAPSSPRRARPGRARPATGSRPSLVTTIRSATVADGEMLARHPPLGDVAGGGEPHVGARELAATRTTRCAPRRAASRSPKTPPCTMPT